jgi:hypothetical protein
MERPITCRIACVKMVPGEVVPGTSAPPPPRDPVKRYQGPTRLGGAPTLTKAPESGGDPARGAPPSPHRGPSRRGIGGRPPPPRDPHHIRCGTWPDGSWLTLPTCFLL